MSGQIYELIPKIMAEVGFIGKSGTNKDQGYTFRKVDDVYAALQPILAKYGVFAVPEVLKDESEERKTKSGSALIYRKLTIKYTFYAPDGSSVPSVVLGEGMDTGDKASNKAMSAGQKYAFCQTLCVPTSDPKDSENENHEVEPRQPMGSHYNANQQPRGFQNSPLDIGQAIGTRQDQPKYKLTEKQLKRIYAISKANGYEPNEVGAYIKSHYGVASSMDLTRSMYEEVCGALETRSLPKPGSNGSHYEEIPSPEVPF